MNPVGRQLRSLARRALPANAHLDRQLDDIRYAIGHLESRLAAHEPAPAALQDCEFKVFSQWGEDGIIQHLVRAVPIADTTFVEIGVADYRESNTRFLAMNNNWRGVIVDSGSAHQEFLRRTETGWRWSIDAVSSFVTAENVDDLIRGARVTGDIGLLSVDVDGMDYWIWKAISVVQPRIVVVEYNSVFGPDHAVTVPYDAGFTVHDAHYSGQYFGASLGALHHLGSAKGYQLVGVGSNGVNAFFVRKDVAGSLPDLQAEQAYVAMRARTSRDAEGNLTFASDHREMLRLIRAKPLWRVDEGDVALVADIYAL